MSIMAKDEYCRYCGGFHPNYLDGCPNIKQAEIVVTCEKYIEIKKDEIVANCPHCGTEYKVDIFREDDNFHVMCIDCRKYFKAVRGQKTLKTVEQHEPRLNEPEQACFISHVSGSTCKYTGNKEGKIHACNNAGGKCERCSYYR